MEFIEIALEEYKTLRQESLTSMQMQQAVLRYGLAIISALIAVAVNAWGDIALSSIVLLVFLPILCYLILMIWMGEVARMMRAGKYLYGLEKKINESFGSNDGPLDWEISLRDFSKGNGTPQLTWNYLAILGLLLFFAVSSIVFGSYRVWGEVGSQLLLVIDVIEIFAFIIAFVILVHLGMRFR